VLSSASSATESADLDTAPGAQDPPPPSEPRVSELQFSEPQLSERQLSELIDRWLQEGDRLNDQAAATEAAVAPARRLRPWQQRALDLGRMVLERHRLELLVAIGLLPLMLFLIARPGHHPAPAAARHVPAAVPRPSRAAPPPPPRPRAAAPAAPTLLSEGLLRQCTADPAFKPAAPVPRPAVHRQTLAVRQAPHAAPPPPPKLARTQPLAKAAPTLPPPKLARTQPPAKAAPQPTPPKLARTQPPAKTAPRLPPPKLARSQPPATAAPQPTPARPDRKPPPPAAQRR